MLSDSTVELISTLIGDAEQFGCDPIDTVEAVAFHLVEVGFGNGEAERIARDAVGVSMH
jgi:hypothetical protein